MAIRFSPAAPPSFRQSYPARPEELGRLRADLRRWLDEIALPREEHGDVLLAVGEACANAIEHAYEDADPGTVEVEIAREALVDDLLVRVRDTGRWRDPSLRDPDRGRGTDVMKALVDVFERETGAAGTTVSFRMRGPVHSLARG